MADRTATGPAHAAGEHPAAAAWRALGVGKRWPDFDAALARNLMWAGLIFRRLAAVEWAAVSLVYTQTDVLEDVVARIRVYHGELGRALHDAPRGAPA